MRIQMVDAKAEPIEAKVDDASPDRPFRIQSEQTFTDPLEVYEQAVQATFLIPKSGVYLCELWANDNMLMQRRFIARQLGDDLT
jgi:hypothetical protein